MNTKRCLVTNGDNYSKQKVKYANVRESPGKAFRLQEGSELESLARWDISLNLEV